MGRVIVMGCGVAGWGALRSLARVSGIQRIALSASTQEMGWPSRYADVRAVCPHPDTQEAALIRYLMDRAREWEGALLLPAGDAQAAALSKHRHTLAKAYRVAVGPWEVVRSFLEKDRLLRISEAAGVPTPRSVRVEPGATDLSRFGTLAFPVWIKPVRSDRLVRQFGRKGFLASDKGTLTQWLTRLRQLDQALIVQEVVPGEDSALERLDLYVAGNGEMVATFAHNKFRQHPPGFGVMRAGYSLEKNPEAEALARRLLAQVPGYRGYASFEFKRDSRDGTLKLIEVNVRITRPGFLATAAGLNFPEMMYREFFHGRATPAGPVEAGVWWIELLPDLYYTFLHRDGRRHGWRDRLRPYRSRRKVFGDLDLRDLRPFVRHLRLGLRRWRQRAGADVQLPEPWH